MLHIESHFGRLSEEMGFEAEVPIRRVREAVFRLGRDGRADLALPVAETLVE